MADQEHDFRVRSFFRGKDTSFGIFYPTGYVIATFDSFETAKKAEATILNAGYTHDDVNAIPGNYVDADIEKGFTDPTWFDRVKQRISEAVGSEAGYWKKDLELARQGFGFLAIYCPNSPEAHRARRLVAPHQPHTMRRYAQLAIEQLV